MDDTLGRQFFAQPINPVHRRYEAVRAVIYDGRPQTEVAEHFGYQPSTLRQLVYEFRRFCRSEHPPDRSPFFRNPNPDDRPDP
jgi:hypothetical protein